MARDLPFPYPYGSDLHHFWGWSHRLDDMLCRDSYIPSSHDWMVFRPCEGAADAMMRYAIDYPTVVAEVKEQLSIVETAFDKLLDDPSEHTEFVFADRLMVLERRIKKACELIAEREGIAVNPDSIPQSAIRTRQREPLRIDDSRGDDSVQAHQAHRVAKPNPRPDLFPNGWPEDEQLASAILLLEQKRPTVDSDRDILRELTKEPEGDCPKAIKLATKIRKHRGKLHTLPKRKPY